MTTICTTLYEHLTSHPDLANFKLEFSPDQEGFEDIDFFCDVNDAKKSAELVVFRKTYFKVFKEAHALFERYILNVDKRDQLTWDDYLMTIGYLLTTSENKMIINIHEECVLRLLLQKKDPAQLMRMELLVIERLLTCTRNSVNKSSSLWIWYRKLFILCRNFKNLDKEKLMIQLISTIRASACLHPSNYYCWTTSRWIFDNMYDTKHKEQLYEMTLEFSLSHPNDCSSWSALCYMICQSRLRLAYNTQDYERLYQRYASSNIGITPKSNHTEVLHLTIDIPKFTDKITDYVDTLVIKDWPVFLCLSKVTSTYGGTSVPAYLQTWSEQISEFERNHGSIEFTNRNPIIPKDRSTDLTLSNSIIHYGWKKRVVESMM